MRIILASRVLGIILFVGSTFIVLLSPISGSENVQNGVNTQAKELSYPQDLLHAVKTHESMALAFYGTGHYSKIVNFIEDNKVFKSSFKFEMALKPDFFKVRMFDGVREEKNGNRVTKTGESVYCYTPEVYFSLKKAKERKEYEVTDLSTPTPKLNFYARENYEWIESSSKIDGTALSEVLSSKLYKPLYINDAIENGKRLIKIGIGPTSELLGMVGTAKKGDKVFYMHLVLSPSDGWIVTKYSSYRHSLSNGKIWRVLTGTLDYKFISTLEIPSRSFVRTLIPPRDGSKNHKVYKLEDGSEFDGFESGVNTFEIDNLKVAKPSDDEFRLTAFGLPDLTRPQPTPQRISVTTWCFVAAFAFLVLSIGLRLIMKKISKQRSK